MYIFFSLFSFILSLDGQLRTIDNPGFDFETQSQYLVEMSVSCYLYESTIKTLTINIVDINENPEYTDDYYEATIQEELVNVPYVFASLKYLNFDQESYSLPPNLSLQNNCFIFLGIVRLSYI